MAPLGESLRQRFFASLADAAALLRLFDFVPNIFLYVKDRGGRFVAMNEALVRLRGCTDEQELLGKTDVDVHPVYWGRRYQEEDRRVMAAQREIPNQVWLVPGADGRLGLYVSSKIPLRGRDGVIIGIAGVMYRLDTESETGTPTSPLQIATELIAKRYRQPLRVCDLASEVGLSVSQFNRRFRAAYYMTPSEYLQRVRVHEASRMLADSDIAVGEVAAATGFYDQAHLTRTFRKWLGMTPKEFRRESRR